MCKLRRGLSSAHHSYYLYWPSDLDLYPQFWPDSMDDYLMSSAIELRKLLKRVTDQRYENLRSAFREGKLLVDFSRAEFDFVNTMVESRAITWAMPEDSPKWLLRKEERKKSTLDA